MHPNTIYAMTIERLSAYEREADHDRLVRAAKAASHSKRSPSETFGALRDLRRMVLRRLLGEAATA